MGKHACFSLSLEGHSFPLKTLFYLISESAIRNGNSLEFATETELQQSYNTQVDKTRLFYNIVNVTDETGNFEIHAEDKLGDMCLDDNLNEEINSNEVKNEIHIEDRANGEINSIECRNEIHVEDILNTIHAKDKLIGEINSNELKHEIHAGEQLTVIKAEDKPYEEINSIDFRNEIHAEDRLNEVHAEYKLIEIQADVKPFEIHAENNLNEHDEENLKVEINPAELRHEMHAEDKQNGTRAEDKLCEEIDPIEPRVAKAPLSFGHSWVNRVKTEETEAMEDSYDTQEPNEQLKKDDTDSIDIDSNKDPGNEGRECIQEDVKPFNIKALIERLDGVNGNKQVADFLSSAEEKDHECSECEFVAKSLLLLAEHTEKVHVKLSDTEVGPFSCDKCGFVFCFEAHLREHMNCNASCLFESNVKKKAKTKKKTVNFLQLVVSSKDCSTGEMKKQTVKEILDITRITLPTECPICRKDLNDFYSYQCHILLHEQFRLQKCHICLKDLDSEVGTKRHYKVHEDRPYSCDVCHKRFETRIRHNYHVNVSCRKIKDKPALICPVCGYQASSL